MEIETIRDFFLVLKARKVPPRIGLNAPTLGGLASEAAKEVI